jgi:hypothetical protein
MQRRLKTKGHPVRISPRLQKSLADFEMVALDGKMQRRVLASDASQCIALGFDIGPQLKQPSH